MIRSEQYLQSVEHRLRDHREAGLVTWLTELGRNTTLKDWQIRLAVDAIRILLCDIAKPPGANQFDWEGWLASARTLEVGHSTVARDYDAAVAPQVAADTVVDDKALSLSPWQKARLGEMTAVLRCKDHAFRTEETYLH